jgi:N-acyl-D-aspartate/D-glutamate deacylase
MAELVIRGGTVVDGTGRPAYRADVRVAGDRIVEVGRGVDATGARTLDAGGAVVAPGFIDSHTHLDPSMFWDPLCDPMPQHGVTTALVGNCSLGLVPVRPELVQGVTDVFCYIEDMPPAAFDDGIPWSWETFDQYRDVIDGMGVSLHTAVLIGHTPLRMYVMGEDAWTRPATGAEVAEMAAVLEASMAAGAFGFSTSTFDEDSRSRPVPSRLADDAEMRALLEVTARHGGVVEFIPGLGSPNAAPDLRRFGGLCIETGATCVVNGIVHHSTRKIHELMMPVVRELRSRGASVWPLISPRTVDLRINWERSMMFMKMPKGWHRVPNAADDAERRRLLTDPAWRAVAREEWDEVDTGFFPVRDLKRVRLVDVTRPEHERLLGHPMTDLVAERGGHPSDVLADWVLDNDLRPGVLCIGMANFDPAGVAELLADDDVLVSSSDAGAHVQMMCAAGDTTLLLTRHVRDRGDFTLEAAVHELTGKQAGVLGLRGRGTVAPGLAADLTVFALDELEWADDVFVDDLPRGARRLRRPAGGYRYTVAAGEVTQEGGTLTGAQPAGVLRVGAG